MQRKKFKDYKSSMTIQVVRNFKVVMFQMHYRFLFSKYYTICFWKTSLVMMTRRALCRRDAMMKRCISMHQTDQLTVRGGTAEFVLTQQ